MRQAVPWWRTLLGFVLLLVFLAVLAAVSSVYHLEASVVGILVAGGTSAFGVLAGKSAYEHKVRGGKDGSGS